MIFLTEVEQKGGVKALQMGVHIDIIPLLTILIDKEFFGTHESLSSYVFLKINLYVRAYTWRKTFCQLGFSHNVCPLNVILRVFFQNLQKRR